LWTHVDRIQNPAALSSVLERCKSATVDIVNLYLSIPDDALFDALSTHMHHIRTLCLHLGRKFDRFSSSTRAYRAFSMPAPLLQRLSMCADRSAESAGHLYIWSTLGISASKMPQLSSLQLRGIDLDKDFFSKLQSLNSFSFSGREDTIRQLGPAVPEFVSQLLRNLTTINLELACWNASSDSPEFGPAVQRINIRWTKPGVFVPSDALPKRAAWSSIRAIHVAQVCSSSECFPVATLTPTNFSIPQTTVPYKTLNVRTSNRQNVRVHVRAIDCEDRERAFCGLHPDTVASMAAHIPGQNLSAITITTTAIALRALSDAQCPVLNRVRIVLDNDDIAWVSIFARDVLRITMLERLEFIVDRGATTLTWSSTLIMCVLACCNAAGKKIQEAVFLGFEPEAQCVTLAAVLTQRVVVDQEWREPESESKWFTELPFEWY